jgi:acyl-CoA synthetase (AMP-forming)/AMP-acid ligase II
VTLGALFANVRAIAARSEMTADDLMVGWLPLYHDMGLVGVTLTPLLSGFPVALMSPMAFLFKPERWLWAMHHFRGTITCAPNFAYHLCAKRIAHEASGGLDLSSMRLAFNGAEFIHADTLDAFAQRFAEHGFRRSAMYPVYGMAEAALGVAFPAPGTEPRLDRIDAELLAIDGRAEPASEVTTTVATVVSVGRALDGYEVRIVGDDGASLGDRRQGEIVLRGPSFTSAYVNAPEDTAASFRDGGFWTGDLGYTDAGELFVCGRTKDLIIKAGRNYHPHAFERAASRVPGVRVGCVAAFGARSAQAGTEDIVVVVETRAAGADEIAALKRAVETEVQRDVGLRPERIIAVPPQSLPKTSSGKVARTTVMRLLAEGRLREAGGTEAATG